MYLSIFWRRNQRQVNMNLELWANQIRRKIQNSWDFCGDKNSVHLTTAFEIIRSRLVGNSRRTVEINLWPACIGETPLKEVYLSVLGRQTGFECKLRLFQVGPQN
jgi:hypothetical protein